jgi:hypothetical protein
MNRMIQVAYNGQTLTPVEELALARTIERLDATYVALYRAADDLTAFVIDSGGGRHLGVRLTVS